MCAGQQYFGTFQNCKFHGTAVYAVHRAATTLRGCRFDNCRPGLTVTGDATMATLSHCTFSRCPSSVVVEAGAAVSAYRCHLERAIAAVACNDANSHAVLRRCTAHGGLAASLMGTGVGAYGGCVQLRSCTIVDFATAARGALADASIEVLKSRIQGGDVRVVHGARATVRGCDMGGALSSTEAAVSLGSRDGRDRSACVQLDRRSVHGGVATGAIVRRGSALSALLCDFTCSRNVLYGRPSEGFGHATVAHCAGSSEGVCYHVTTETERLRMVGGVHMSDWVVCMLDGGSQLSVRACELAGRGAAGCQAGMVSLTNGATGRMSQCLLRHGANGIQAHESTLIATGVTIRDIHRVAGVDSREGTDTAGSQLDELFKAYSSSGGRAEISGGVLERCNVGVYSDGGELDQGELRVEGVKFVDCVRGVAVSGGCEAVVSKCEFLGLNRAREDVPAMHLRADARFVRAMMAVSIQHGPHATVQHCRFEGHHVDLNLFRPAHASIQHCAFRGDGGAGVLDIAVGMLGVFVTVDAVPGAVAVEDCSFAGKAALKTLLSASCVVRRCRVNAAGSVAFTADRGSGLSVADSVMEACRAGVNAMENALVDLVDCKISNAAEGIRVEGGGVALTATRVKVGARGAVVASARHGGDPGSVKLDECEFSGSAVGVAVGDVPGGELSVTRCQVSRCIVGVSALAQVRATLRHCRIVKCERAIIVGDAGVNVCAACGRCGRIGPDAVVAADEALLASGGDPEQAGRCVHEGAISYVRLEDVDVDTCARVGVEVGPHGHVEASRVAVLRSGTGYVVHSIGQRSTFVDCTAERCEVAVRGWRQVSATGRDGPDRVPVPVPGISVVTTCH